MTEAEKKAVYDKAYAESLEWYKNEYKKYEDCLKVPLDKRWKLIEHIKAIWSLMAECGVCMYEKTEKPMSDIGDIMLKFKDEGDPSSLREVLVSSHQSCWSVIKLEQTEEEIEAAARSSAKIEVEMAEHREQKKKEEEEERKRLEAAQAEEEKAEAEAKAKAKKEMDKWQAEENAKKAELEAWYEKVRTELDKMRKGHYDWSIHDHFDVEKIAKIRNYVWKLFDFTDVQNEGLTGYGLYAQNQERARAHEDMLDYLGLYDNKYAMHVTKSYDFSDDYDPKTEQYKHLDEDVVVDMLGYALLEAEMHEAMKKGVCLR